MSLGRKVLRGSLLSYGSFIASKALLFLSTLVLARVLAPRDFGLVGYALVAISLLDVMKDLGVTAALVYRRDISDADAGDAFTLTVGAGVFFFALCWIGGPLVAAFFHDARVTALTRALGLSFVLYGLGGVHAALLQKRMSFGRGVLPDLAQGATKGAVSVGLALYGLGYWSLVWGQLLGIGAATVTTWLLLPWRPRLGLRLSSARLLLGYGLHITVINALGIAIYNGDYAIVGRTLGSAALGLYTLAYSIPQMLTLSLAIALSRVIFPAYATLRDDRAGLRRGYLAVLRWSALALVPVGIGLCAAAPFLVHTLYKPAWWSAIPALQALAVYATVYAVGWNDGDIYKATGRPDIQWKLGLAHIVVLLPALLLGARLGGFVGVALAQVAVAVPYSLARFWLIRRVLGVDARTIVLALRPTALAGAGLLVVVLAVPALVGPATPPVVTLALQGLLGGLCYALAILALDREVRGRVMALATRRTHAASGTDVPAGSVNCPLRTPVTHWDRRSPCGTPPQARGVPDPDGRPAHRAAGTAAVPVDTPGTDLSRALDVPDLPATPDLPSPYVRLLP